MESLRKDILLQFNPDTLEAVRKAFNLDQPGRMDEAIDILDDWVKKQTHFTKKDFSREYLERTLISTKGLIQRAKTRMDKLCTFKTLMPNFFKNTDAKKEFAELHKVVTHAHLPQITPDNYRIYFFKLNAIEDVDSSFISIYYKYVIVMSEYMKMHEYCTGYILVLDFTDANLMSFVTKINIVELRQAMTLLMDGYGMRLKGLHIITPSKAITAFVSILKQVLSEKLGNRIQCHKDIETIYEYVPRNILPVEYGGEERPLKQLNEEWIKVISSKEHAAYIEVMNDAKTIESCRQADKFTEQYIGTPGSFRSLCVD